VTRRAALEPSVHGRVGHGAAFGAVSILNATATGTGCALAVAAETTATWEWTGEVLVADTPGSDAALVKAVLSRMRKGWPRADLGLDPGIDPGAVGVDPGAVGVDPGVDAGARVATRCPFPPSRGLKTSSSAAGALVRAAAAASGLSPGWETVANVAVDASLAAGVTLTGAFDDQVAVLRGGAHRTDNARRTVLDSFEVPPWHVAVWVPDAAVPKPRLAAFDASSLRKPASALPRPEAADDLPALMTANGRLFHRAYAAAGLPVDDRPTQAALAAGALGAGLSGTGPAVAALFEAPVPLPDVKGGRWAWTRAVGVRA